MKGAIAVSLEEMEAVAAKKRQQGHGGTAPGKKNTSANLGSSERAPQARDKAAAIVGVSHGYVSDAKAIKSAARSVRLCVVTGRPPRGPGVIACCATTPSHLDRPLVTKPFSQVEVADARLAAVVGIRPKWHPM